MSNEVEIQNDLVKKFSFLEGKTKVQRPRRVLAEVPYDKFDEVFKYAYREAGFSLLCTITGLDEVQSWGFIYHLARPSGELLNIKTNLPKDGSKLRSIMPLFPNAEIYEREIEDLLGVKVDALPPGKRYPLPDDWPDGSYPLRKDWKPEKK
jgi:membrane-bound hydrogenase subunit beta